MIEVVVLKNGDVQLNYLIANKVAGRLRYGDIDTPSLYIPYLHINKPYRRYGLGTELIIEAIKQGVGNGCKAVSLFVSIDNKEAISFYKRLGFFITLNKKNKRGEKYYLMSKQI